MVVGPGSWADFGPEELELAARAHEGPGAPHEGGAQAAAAGDCAAGRRGPG